MTYPVRCIRRSCTALLLLLALGTEAATANPSIEFSPTGLVKQPRQARAEFPSAMIALGDPRAVSSPFQINCAHPGAQRWVDSQTWVFDFDADVPGGTSCTFSTVADLKTLDGQPIAAASFQFSTGGPSIISWQPSWGEIAEDQAFVLGLDAAASNDSILEHVYLTAEDVSERIGVHVIEGEDRAQILATLSPEERREPLVVVQPRQTLPAARKVQLIWGAAVETPDSARNKSDQTLDFRTRDAFTATLSCTRAEPKAGCSPLRPIYLNFSASVSWELARHVTLRANDGRTWQPLAPNANSEAVEDIQFRGPFPEATSFVLELPPSFADHNGRALINAARFPLELETSPYPPLAKFPSRFGILEANAAPALALTVRNIEPEIRIQAHRSTEERDISLSARLWRSFDQLRGRQHHIPAAEIERVLPWLQRLSATDRETSIFAGANEPNGKLELHEFVVPKPLATSETEVIGIPLSMPGLHIVEVESPSLGAALLGKAAPMYVPAAALVTNLGVHFKWGGENALVWVTRLDSSDPVADVEVFVLDCSGATLWEGKTDSLGRAEVNGLPRVDTVQRCPRTAWPGDFWTNDFRGLHALEGGLLVIARTAEDFSFAHSGWDDGIEPWRFRVRARGYGDPNPIVVHTILDRALYRAGDTVHMKHLFRQRTSSGLRIAEPETSSRELRILHLATGEAVTLEAQADAQGVALTTWKIPDNVKLGRYIVTITGADRSEDSGSFRIEEFRVPLMSAAISVASDKLLAPTAVDADLSLRYLAGGPARGAAVTVRSQIRPRPFSAPYPWSNLSFAAGPVATGTFQRATFDEESASTDAPTVRRSELTLDATGTARHRVDELTAPSVPSELLIDMEYRDPSGEVQSASRRVPIYPSEYLVAITPERWVASGDLVQATVVVVDTAGVGVANVDIAVEVFTQQVYSHRKRLVGGFYAYEHTTEVKGPVATLCKGKTGINGTFICEGTTTLQGNLLLQATVHDAAGRTSTSHASQWVAGDSDWWFRVEDHDRIDLLPERFEYMPGETARLQVRSPFTTATALVTLEREGVIDSFVQHLSGREPVIEVPIRREHAPNVFVSVLLVRGRISGIAPTALLDLGKPAYKVGLAELRVGWDQHRLDVSLRPDSESYRVREAATVRVEVRRADGSALPPGAEVAVAAVDEGLLTLAPNPSWNLLAAMMEPRSHWVATATAQGHVVGKRHFGRKALPTGGGGGLQSARELFDTLLFWDPRVRLDEHGLATVRIPLNDSLTSFRIVAVATAGSDQFGTGSTTIRSTQDLMILPGLAPLVREGDQFAARFTVRNATDVRQEVVITTAVAGVSAQFDEKNLTLDPGEAREIAWPIEVPRGVKELRYTVIARAGSAVDEVVAKQSVVPVHRVETQQATLVQLATAFEQQVARPVAAEADRGGVRITLSPTLGGSLGAVRDYMQSYSYTCLEQRVSRAVVLADDVLWNEIVNDIPQHQDRDGLLTFFPGAPHGSVELTAYVLAIAAAAELELPEPLRDSLTAALRNFLSGGLRHADVSAGADLPLRRLTAIEALARHGAADPSMLESIRIEPQYWPTSSILDWWSITLQMDDLADVAALRQTAERTLRSRMRVQGTTISFGAERDQPWGIFACADDLPLRLLLLSIDAKAGEAFANDRAQILRAATQRQRQGRWECTTSNAWGAVAFRRFAAAFEAEAVAGATSLRLGQAEAKVPWHTDDDAKREHDLRWPAQDEPLRIEHSGSGEPWAVIQTRAALPITEPIAAGYRITRRFEPIEQRTPERYSRGDIWRVHLEIDALSAAPWVVVDDPLPPGASHLGTGLGSGSMADDAAADVASPWWAAGPTYVERRQESFRAYYEWFPEGTATVAYTIRLNQDGSFEMPPTRVEALYSPEAFGVAPNARIEIGP